MPNITYQIHNSDVLERIRTCADHLTEDQKQVILEQGFIKLPFCLPSQKLWALRDATDRLSAKKFSVQTNTYKSKKFAGRYIREPHLQDMTYMELLSGAYPFVDMVRSLLGPRVCIRSYSIRITDPYSGDGTSWHSDQRSFVTPPPPLFTEPHVLTLSIYLDRLTTDSGLFYVRPKTHRWPVQPVEEEAFADFPDQVELSLEPGEGVLFDSALWHRGGGNNSQLIRRALIIHFAPIFCRQAQYEVTSPSPAYLDYIEKLKVAKDEPQLELLGLPGLRFPLFM